MPGGLTCYLLLKLYFWTLELTLSETSCTQGTQVHPNKSISQTNDKMHLGFHNPHNPSFLKRTVELFVLCVPVLFICSCLTSSFPSLPIPSLFKSLPTSPLSFPPLPFSSYQWSPTSLSSPTPPSFPTLSSSSPLPFYLLPSLPTLLSSPFLTLVLSPSLPSLPLHHLLSPSLPLSPLLLSLSPLSCGSHPLKQKLLM